MLETHTLAKKKSATEKVLENINVYQDLSGNSDAGTQNIAKRLKNQSDLAAKEKEKVLEKTEMVQKNIEDLQSDFKSFQREATLKQEKIIQETEKICAENNAVIQQLKENIEYQEDLIEFSKRLASVEIVQVSPQIQFRFFMLRSEHIFNLEDNGDSFTYTPVTFNLSNQGIHDYLKDSITFEKSQTPKLFFAIFQLMSNAN